MYSIVSLPARTPSLIYELEELETSIGRGQDSGYRDSSGFLFFRALVQEDARGKDEGEALKQGDYVCIFAFGFLEFTK